MLNQKPIVDPFTTTIPHLECVTEKYKFISTAQFIEDVQSLGYSLTATKGPRRGFGMHSMQFTHPSLPTADGLSMRLLATNSHDGTSAFRLYVQVLVQVCSNGLVAWREDKDSASRILHRGYALSRLVEAVDRTHGRFEGVLSQIEAFKGTQASPEGTAAFIQGAAELRDARPFRLFDLQAVRHNEQSENTAWNVFNRVQESLIRGGYETENAIVDPVTKGPVRVPGSRARHLTSVKERVKVNTKLWELAVEKLLK